MGELKTADRYQLPELDTFQRKIADDDFEIEMPTNNETKAAAIAGKASKSWRALRIAARSKLVSFDKIDDPKKVSIVFEDVVEGENDELEIVPTANDEDFPKNRDAIIISGPSAVGKSAIVNKLLERNKGVFASVVRHTIREPEEGEVNGKEFHFVKIQEFNQLRDGDRLIEYGTRDGTEYGTSTKVIDAITEQGKVPIIELDIEVSSLLILPTYPSFVVCMSLTQLIFHRLRNSPKIWTILHDTSSSNHQATTHYGHALGNPVTVMRPQLRPS